MPQSIDVVAETLDHSLENDEFELVNISVETRFWVHCSNLQVWAENNYDTRLLHSNLSFPLVKKLTEKGDPVAKKVFKEEIAKRFASNYHAVINFLTKEGYDDFLSREEFFNSILVPTQADAMIELEKILNIRYYLTDKIEYLHSDFGDDKELFTVKDKNVAELELNYNESYPEMLLDFLQNFSHLKRVCLFTDERVEIFPKASHNLNSLLELRIVIYGWTQVPDIFDKFPNLKKLEVLGGKASHNFDSLITLKSLEVFRFHSDEIINLPENIGKLKLSKKTSKKTKIYT